MLLGLLNVFGTLQKNRMTRKLTGNCAIRSHIRLTGTGAIVGSQARRAQHWALALAAATAAGATS